MKEYKILGDGFRRARALSVNSFSWDEEKNNITQKNIDEILAYFSVSNEKVWFYENHKKDMGAERKPIGFIKTMRPCDDEIGLMATVEWNEGSEHLIDAKGFYPSVEILGQNKGVDWSGLSLKAVALVEYPASKGVDLICASAVIIEHEKIVIDEGEKNMDERIEDLIERIRGGDETARQELFSLFDDDEMRNAFIDTLLANAPSAEAPAEEVTETVEETAPAEGTMETTTETVKETEDLSAVKLTKAQFDKQWAIASSKHAVSLSGTNCAFFSEASIGSEAYKYYKGGSTFDAAFAKFGAIPEEDGGLVVMGIKEVKENVAVNLSGLSPEQIEEKNFAEIGKGLQEMSEGR